MMPKANPLCTKVRKIDLGQVYVILAKDKIVFSPKGGAEHVTLHFGPQSKMIDIHTTTRVAGEPDRHARLYSVLHSHVPVLVGSVAPPLLAELQSLARPLRLDYMERSCLGAIVGIPLSSDDLQYVGVFNKGKLAVDYNKLAEGVWAPEFLEELYDLEGQMFSIYSCKNRRRPKKIGVGFTCPDRVGHRRLMWIPDRLVDEMFCRSSSLLLNAAARYGVVEAR